MKQRSTADEERSVNHMVGRTLASTKVRYSILAVGSKPNLTGNHFLYILLCVVIFLTRRLLKASIHSILYLQFLPACAFKLLSKLYTGSSLVKLLTFKFIYTHNVISGTTITGYILVLSLFVNAHVYAMTC